MDGAEREALCENRTLLTLDTASDDIGLTLMDAQLPKRVRGKRDPSGAL